ncbi:MAG: diguanylate cyclase [Gammaproteobacteria bacterium]|nr:diguanylate cyclase [Gammaproteobacteria bacterium]
MFKQEVDLHWKFKQFYLHLKKAVLSFSHCLTDCQSLNQLVHNHNSLLNGAIIFQNSADGMLITDTNHKIVSINHSFTHITGYSEKEILGKTPNFLQSGRHNENFYRDLWGSINKTGQWQGQIWNKRKNGEIYPELLTINTIKDESGKITYHMGVFSDLSTVDINNPHLKHLAFHDYLTGLPNRLQLSERLKQEITCANNTHLSMAVLFIDFDGFKAVNDEYGHDLGDLVLSMAANRLNHTKRNSDFLARVGGDEFVLIINALSDEAVISQIAENIIDSMKLPFHTDQCDVTLGASIGISVYPNNSLDSDDLIKQADSAMYQSKSNGRNHYTFYNAH